MEDERKPNEPKQSWFAPWRWDGYRWMDAMTFGVGVLCLLFESIFYFDWIIHETNQPIWVITYWHAAWSPVTTLLDYVGQ